MFKRPSVFSKQNGHKVVRYKRKSVDDRNSCRSQPPKFYGTIHHHRSRPPGGGEATFGTLVRPEQRTFPFFPCYIIVDRRRLRFVKSRPSPYHRTTDNIQITVLLRSVRRDHATSVELIDAAYFRSYVTRPPSTIRPRLFLRINGPLANTNDTTR